MFEDEEFRDYLGARVERGYEALRETDGGYAAIFDRRKAQMERYQAICEKLSAEDKEALASIEKDAFDCRAIEEFSLYWQGYRDCIRLLKTLNILAGGMQS